MAITAITTRCSDISQNHRDACSQLPITLYLKQHGTTITEHLQVTAQIDTSSHHIHHYIYSTYIFICIRLLYMNESNLQGLLLSLNVQNTNANEQPVGMSQTATWLQSTLFAYYLHRETSCTLFSVSSFSLSCYLKHKVPKRS